MIKVLAHGYPFRKYKCDWCGCEFEAADDELETKPSILSDQLEQKTIICPNCRTEIAWDVLKREDYD